MINDIFKSFFRTIGRILAYIAVGLAIAYLSGFIHAGKVSALENSNIGTFIGEGNFYSLQGYPTAQSMGFQVNNALSGNSDLWSAIPTNTNWTYGQNGGALTQCGMSFVAGFYYSVSYHFLISSMSNYLHPFYTSWAGHRVGILNTIDAKPSFEYASVSAGLEMTKYLDNDYIGSFTVIFKAPNNGTCVSIAFSSYDRATNPQLAPFVGYKYSSLGSAPLTEEQIRNALSADVNDIKTRIDSMKDEQQKTNSKLDDLNSKQDKTNDTLTSDDDDTTSKKCGVVCKLKGIFTGIIELPKKIITLLIDALKSLFIPEDTEFITNFVDSIESKLGFIAEVPVSIISFAINLVNASWTEVTSISFPSINIFGYYFWDAQTIDISEGLNIFKPFKYVTDVICVVLCAATLNRWREKFTGGGS